MAEKLEIGSESRTTGKEVTTSFFPISLALSSQLHPTLKARPGRAIETARALSEVNLSPDRSLQPPESLLSSFHP